MKKVTILAALASGFTLTANAQLKVGNNPTTLNSSAVLDVESTTKGFLLPRMTTAQRTAITNPAAGLQVYDTETKSLWYFDGIQWVNSALEWVYNATDAIESKRAKDNGQIVSVLDNGNTYINQGNIDYTTIQSPYPGGISMAGNPKNYIPNTIFTNSSVLPLSSLWLDENNVGGGAYHFSHTRNEIKNDHVQNAAGDVSGLKTYAGNSFLTSVEGVTSSNTISNVWSVLGAASSSASSNANITSLRSGIFETRNLNQGTTGNVIGSSVNSFQMGSGPVTTLTAGGFSSGILENATGNVTNIRSLSNLARVLSSVNVADLRVLQNTASYEKGRVNSTYGQFNSVNNISPDTHTVTSATGIYTQNLFGTGAVQNVTTQRGIDSRNNYNGTGLVGTQEGLFALNTLASTNTGVTGSMIGAHIQNNFAGAGTVTEQHGLRVQNATSTAATGTVANSYGISILNSKVAGSNATVTNRYGLYINGIQDATTENYAIYTNQGKVRLGDKVQIQDGTQGIGKILVSDADGVGTWTDAAIASASEWVYNGTDAVEAKRSKDAGNIVSVLGNGKYTNLGNVDYSTMFHEAGGNLFAGNPRGLIPNLDIINSSVLPLTSSFVDNAGVNEGSFHFNSKISIVNNDHVANATGNASSSKLYSSSAASVTVDGVTSNNLINAWGSQNGAIIRHSNANVGSLRGLYAYADNYNQGTTGNVIGLTANAFHSGSGQATNLNSTTFNSHVTADATGNVTNLRALSNTSTIASPVATVSELRNIQNTASITGKATQTFGQFNSVNNTSGVSHTVTSATGIYTQNLFGTGAVQNVTTQRGIDSRNNYNGTGLVGTQEGLFALNTLASTNTGVTGSMIGAHIQNNFAGAGTVTEQHGLRVQNATSTAATGTVANSYGISILNSKVAGSNATVTNRYGLYINGIQDATNTNYAIYSNEGKVRFGDHVETVGTVKVGNIGTATPEVGMIRYNSSTNKFQGFVGGTTNAWVDLHN